MKQLDGNGGGCFGGFKNKVGNHELTDQCAARDPCCISEGLPARFWLRRPLSELGDGFLKPREDTGCRQG